MHRLILVLLLAWVSASPAAERVISLAPSLTDIVTELGAQQRLVGVLDAGPRPPALAHIASVGRYGQLNIEAVLSLKPDLLLLWPGSVGPAQRDQLQRLGIAMLVVEPHTLDELADAFETIGDRVNAPDKGRALANTFRQRLAALRRQYHRDVPLRVFYQVWSTPLYTVGGGQIISDAIRACGGENIFADLKVPAPQVSIEAVLQRDPDVILVPDAAQATSWGKWPQVAAVKAQKVWIRDPALERPSGAMLDATEQLCWQLSGS